MSMFSITIVLIIAAVVWWVINERKRIASMSPEERLRYLKAQQEAAATQMHGPLNHAMICPHCGERGMVRTMAVDRKKGISGGKATAALLTGGVSMLATGLSRKEQLTRAHCDNCRTAWEF